MKQIKKTIKKQTTQLDLNNPKHKVIILSRNLLKILKQIKKILRLNLKAY
jgi:hypothetical protein